MKEKQHHLQHTKCNDGYTFWHKIEEFTFFEKYFSVEKNTDFRKNRQSLSYWKIKISKKIAKVSYSQVPKYETFLGEILGKKSHILASHRIYTARGKYGDKFLIKNKLSF